MIEELNKKINEKSNDLEELFSKQKKDLELPIYSSFDIRNSGYKAVVIDSNAFPSGFNNICEDSYPIAEAAIKSFIKESFPNTAKIAIISEITDNPYYYDNIAAIKELFEKSGFNVLIGSIEKPENNKISSFSKGEIQIEKFSRKENIISLGSFVPDIIISNNDFSSSDTSILLGIAQPVTPNFNLGWFKRKKHHHFRVKNLLIKEIAKILDIDRWLIGAYYEYAKEVDFKERKNFDMIAEKIDACIAQIKLKHDEYAIKEEPYVFVKGSASTYGMNAIPFCSGKDFLKINSKQRAKMHKSKGGKEVSEVLIQEGIITKDIVDSKVAEPVVYCIGDKPIGGFFRANKDKDETQNLNSKGMTFASNLFCPPAFREKKVFEGSNITKGKIEVYAFLARLGSIAIAKELEELR